MVVIGTLGLLGQIKASIWISGMAGRNDGSAYCITLPPYLIVYGGYIFFVTNIVLFILLL